MSSDEKTFDELIWATRGRAWGFRFLLDGGRPDPLPDYDSLFGGLGDEPAAWRRDGVRVALRFPDPLRRRDSAGRVIPHEFVVPGDLADGIESVEDGLRKVWPVVAAAYAQIWDVERPPTSSDLRRIIQSSPPNDTSTTTADN